jgi:hypothetical protein
MAVIFDTMGKGAPEGAEVLFDGTSLDGWTNQDGGPAEWLVKDGAMEVVPGKGRILTEYTFRDCYLHLEFKLSDMPEATGQKKSNSGVFLQDRYEIQVLDSYGWEIPGTGDCGAVYNHHAPLVNACKPPLEWQTYDIFFRAPRFAPGRKKIENARITLFHNGVLIHNNVEQWCRTAGNPPPPDEWDTSPGPLQLQDHKDVVWYRNIWLLPLPEQGSPDYSPK